MKKLYMALAIALLATGCYSHVPVVTDTSYKAEVTNESPFAVFIESTNAINPEYITLTITNISTTKFTVIYRVAFNTTEVGAIELPAHSKKDLSIWTGCTGTSCRQGIATLLFTNEQSVYVKKVTW